MTANYTSADALKYAAALLKSRTDWACDSIGGSMCGGHHDTELDAVTDAVTDVLGLAAQFGDPRVYSDGRLVESGAWIQNGLYTSHVWHPDPTAESPQSWRSHLPSGDPDIASPGCYEVTLTPATQDIHIRVVRVA